MPNPSGEGWVSWTALGRVPQDGFRGSRGLLGALRSAVSETDGSEEPPAPTTLRRPAPWPVCWLPFSPCLWNRNGSVRWLSKWGS